jgi:hypothetical protein
MHVLWVGFKEGNNPHDFHLVIIRLYQIILYVWLYSTLGGLKRTKRVSTLPLFGWLFHFSFFSSNYHSGDSQPSFHFSCRQLDSSGQLINKGPFFIRMPVLIRRPPTQKWASPFIIWLSSLLFFKPLVFKLKKQTKKKQKKKRWNKIENKPAVFRMTWQYSTKKMSL